MAIKIPQRLDDRDEDKLALDVTADRWLTEAKSVHQALVAEYNDIDTKMNGEYGLAGFTSDSSAELERINDPNRATDKSLIFVSTNRARPNHESVLGDFIQTKRKLGVKGRTPRDRNRAKVFQKRLEYIEDENQMASKVIFPCFDEAFAKGTCWVDVTFSERLTKPVHKFKVEMVSARDVLVDPVTRGIAFDASRYRIRRMRYELEDAREKFIEYPFFIPDKLNADTEYDEGYAGGAQLSSAANANATNTTSFSPTTTDKFCTIYKFIFWQYERDYFQAKTVTDDQGNMAPSPGRDIEQISKVDYNRMMANPKTAPYVFAGPLEERYYLMLYNRGTGVFHIEPHKIGDYTLVPLVNIHTLWRFWPYGDFKMYANLASLFDMLIALMVENARKNNQPIVEVDDEMWTLYQGQIEKVIREGGAAPGIRQVHNPGQLNEALVSLLPMVAEWMRDNSSKHSVSMGELPSHQVAKETVLALMQKDRTGHGRKDVMVNLFLTTLAKVLVKMVMMLDREPDFIPIEDAPEGSPEYIPINQTWSEGEYMTNLAMIANLPTEASTPEEYQQINQMLMAVKKKFESTNEVTSETFEGYRINSGKKVQEMKPDELSGAVKASGLELKDVWAIYKPQQGIYKRFHINEFTDDADLSVIYSIDADLRNDQQFQLARAEKARHEGIMSRLDFAEELGFTNAEEMIDRADQENQAMMLAKEIAANPELFKQVMLLLQNARQVIQNKNGQKQPAEAQ